MDVSLPDGSGIDALWRALRAVASPRGSRQFKTRPRDSIQLATASRVSDPLIQSAPAFSFDQRIGIDSTN